jgi:hypothetical protein
MSCGTGGKKKSVYTGNQVGHANYVGEMNYVAGGPVGSGLSAGTTIVKFIPNGTNRRPWLRQDAILDDKLLDACYPQIELSWFVEVILEPDTVFRVSNKSFYVQDEDGVNRYIDARVERPPQISVTVGEWLSPNYEVSDASFSLNNRDGHYNQWLPLGDDYRQWSGAKVNVYVGFGELRTNYFRLFEGQITTKQGLSTTRDSIEIKAYDKLDLDEIPMPPRVFSSDNFPDISEDSAGKPIPLVYGDWTSDVPDAGSVNATCINANDDTAIAYLFKVSDIELESIDEIYLHRGKRKEGEVGGPVKLDLPFVTLDLPNGQFIIPKGVDVLDDEVSYTDNSTAGPGSGLNLITADGAGTNFVTQKIQPGDRVIKRKTGEVATVSIILSTQLQLTGGVTFDPTDEYIVLTRKYAFIKGDKLTVKCKGKTLNNISVTRLSDVSTAIKRPQGISIDFDATYWIADDETQKVYHIGFDNLILKEILYSDIDPSITKVSAICVASDQKIWVTAPDQSKIYRYDHEVDELGLTIDTAEIVGLMASLGNLQGIAVQTDNRFWIADETSGNFYLVDVFDAVEPFVVSSFNRSAFDASATQCLDISIDEANDQLVIVDRDTNKWYRVDTADGSLVSSTLLTALAPNVSNVTGVSVAQDGSLFFVDQNTLAIYNYNEQSDASTNPAFIARDILQKFGGHSYGEFDLSWNATARQLADYKCRAVLDKTTNLITYINKLLGQYNVVFHLRFQRFGLFWITFDNFRTDGKLVKEKDIKENTFKPTKEMNQYFNSAKATYNYRPFTNSSFTSDTYVSPAAVSFAGKEVPKTLDLANVYRREDLDKLMPLYVKLSAPEPEFVEVTFGFRVLRTQMHDFLTVLFDGDVNCKTGRKESGRRYNNIPCMVRKMAYDLGPMTVNMKLWSLGNTQFGDYEPKGQTVGGEGDTVVLSNLGRLGRISPVGTITGNPDTKVIALEDFNGFDAQTRANGLAGKSWQANYKVDIIDGATKDVLQTLTIASVTGQEITFVEDVTVSLTPTVKNAAGFITGGHYLQYSTYGASTNGQRQIYASFSRPTTNYPTSRTQELEEQRAGVHNFDDNGIPYVLYPIAFVSY